MELELHIYEQDIKDWRIVYDKGKPGEPLMWIVVKTTNGEIWIGNDALKKLVDIYNELP